MKTLLLATALALAVSSAALADEPRHGLQCTMIFSGSYPGPKELEQLRRLPKEVLETRLKPSTMEVIYEFLPDGTVAASTIDNPGEGPSGTAILTLTTSSLLYSLATQPIPSRPRDHAYTTIDRQTGVITGMGSTHSEVFDEDSVGSWKGQCHAITIPTPKL